MPNLLPSQITREGPQAIVQPAGDITASHAPELRDTLKTLITDGAREIVLDLVNTHMIDSSGIGLLVATHNSLARLEGRLSVTNAGPDLLELFKAFRLDKHFSISGLAR